MQQLAKTSALCHYVLIIENVEIGYFICHILINFWCLICAALMYTTCYNVMRQDGSGLGESILIEKIFLSCVQYSESIHVFRSLRSHCWLHTQTYTACIDLHRCRIQGGKVACFRNCQNGGRVLIAGKCTISQFVSDLY